MSSVQHLGIVWYSDDVMFLGPLQRTVTYSQLYRKNISACIGIYHYHMNRVTYKAEICHV